MISLPLWWSANIFQGNLEKFFYAQVSEPFNNLSEVKIPVKPEKPGLSLEAKSAISIKIMKSGGEKILFKKNTEEILPLASLTKLMAAVIILEDTNYDLKQTLTISKTAAGQENVPNYGNLKAGESFTVEKLLELMLSYSSNDAAFALAELIGVDNFVEKMNLKVQSVGLNQTQFLNLTGLDPDSLFYGADTQKYFNYSSANDLANLVKYILKNHPLILETTLKKKAYSIQNSISDLILTEGQTMLGGKTGYTDEAGGCLIFLFQDEKGNIFINVILGAPSAPARIQDAQKLIDWINSSR